MNEPDAPVGVNLHPPKPIVPPQGEEALVHGPTSRPNEPLTTNTTPREIPQYVFDAIPALLRAGEQPDAPPAIRAMLRLIDYEMHRKAAP